MLYTNFRVSAKSTPKLAQGYFGTLAPISAQVFCADFCANRDRRTDRNGHHYHKYDVTSYKIDMKIHIHHVFRIKKGNFHRIGRTFNNIGWYFSVQISM